MPSSLNIIYIVSKMYEALSGVSLTSAQAQGLMALQYVEWIALALSLVALIGFIWMQLQLAAVEHRGHHLRLQEELRMFHVTGQPAKNPRWESVMALGRSSSESDWRRGVLEADTMLGDLLTQRGFIGADIGEQLRSATVAHFASLENAWEAHRVRNHIAHSPEQFILTQREALAVLDNYRRVFEEFQYI